MMLFFRYVDEPPDQVGNQISMKIDIGSIKSCLGFKRD